jgi:hypothetical protein
MVTTRYEYISDLFDLVLNTPSNVKCKIRFSIFNAESFFRLYIVTDAKRPPLPQPTIAFEGLSPTYMHLSTAVYSDDVSYFSIVVKQLANRDEINS